MKIFVKLKRFVSLNGDFFLKIRKLSASAESGSAKSGTSPKNKRFWIYAESLGEFRLALYIADIIKSIFSEKDEPPPVFFISFKTFSTLALAQMLAEKNKGGGILYFFHPFPGLKPIFKKYASAVKPGYFISVQHPASKRLIKEIFNAVPNAKLIFAGISAAGLKKMGINTGSNHAGGEGFAASDGSSLLAEVSGSCGEMNVKISALPVSLKFMSCGGGNGESSACYEKIKGGGQREENEKIGQRAEIEEMEDRAEKGQAEEKKGRAVIEEREGNEKIGYREEGEECGENGRKNIAVSFVSVHKKESDFILELVKEIISDESLPRELNLKFIFVPRNIKNSGRLFKAASKIGLSPVYYGENAGLENLEHFLRTGGIKALIVDKYGVLDEVYSVSDIVYVGKSLFKSESGGHNVLEPASYGKPVITGAYAVNFKDIIDEMAGCGAAAVTTEENFGEVLMKLIKDEKLRKEAGKNGLNFCLKKRDEFKSYFKNYLTGVIA